MGRPGLGAAAVLLLAGCSPAYVARSASGHAGLLWRRRSIERSLADPSLPPERRAKLALAADARRFAFERLALERTRDYSSWTPVEGRALTWLVSAAPRARLEPHLFRFPFAGAFPYKGHFDRRRADAEAAELEARGLDAAVMGASAYNTPLPFADPIPSTLLEYPEGDLVETLIHELAHGTVYVKDRADFNEAVAQWIAARGTEAFLAARFGPDSPELRAWREGSARAGRVDALYRELRGRLEALYAGSGPEPEKVEARKAVFDWARAESKARGLRPFPEPLNNAVVLAHGLYAPDLGPFDALFERNGRDWARTVAALRALDRKDPFGALGR